MFFLEIAWTKFYGKIEEGNMNINITIMNGQLALSTKYISLDVNQ